MTPAEPATRPSRALLAVVPTGRIVNVQPIPRPERITAWGIVLVVALCALYWAATLVLASRKLMWNDELYTYYIATLPSIRDIWGALMARGEQTPPLFYAVTRLSLQTLGVTNVSIRLPEMLGFWLMCASLFLFVARRTSVWSGLCAALLPTVTTAYPYAFEARSYALVMGMGAMSLVFWQNVALERHRRLSLVCLATSLAATASFHYYGLFIVLAIGAGEIVRSMIGRRVDVAVWITFLVAAVPLYWQLPLIRAGAMYSMTFWSPPQWINVPDFYQDLLTPAIVPLTTILVMSASLVGARDRRADDVRLQPFPLHEVTTAIGLILMPVALVVIAKLATGAFVNRYALPAVIGLAILAGFGAAAAYARHSRMQVLVVLCLGGWFGLSQARELLEPTGATLPVSAERVARPSRWLARLPGADRTLPLVIADPHSFTVLSYHGTPEIRSQIVYVADPARALTRRGANSVERGMLDLVKPWFGLNVVTFDSFVGQHSEFLLYGDFMRLAFLNWILPELHASGLTTELLEQEGDDTLFRVSAGHGFESQTRTDTPQIPVPTHGRLIFETFQRP